MALKDADTRPLDPGALRDMTTDELADGLQQLEEGRFRLRFRAATEDVENPMQFRMMRRNIARIRTVLRERRQG